MALPAQNTKSASFYEDLRAKVQSLVDDGAVSGSDTVTTFISFLTTERDDQ